MRLQYTAYVQIQWMMPFFLYVSCMQKFEFKYINTIICLHFNSYGTVHCNQQLHCEKNDVNITKLLFKTATSHL